MYRVIECLTLEHNLVLVVSAALICIIGSGLTVRLTMRLISTGANSRLEQLLITGLIGGATIWSTHFVAMLAYDNGLEATYEPVWTVISLLVAIAGITLCSFMMSRDPQGIFGLLSGLVLGLTISAMHYTGVSAYLLPGRIVWDVPLLIASVSLGMLFGLGTAHRIAWPVTRYCWMGAAVFMVLGICTMHFTSMAAIRVELDPNVVVPPKALSDMAMAVLVMSVTAVIFLLGFSSVTIETNIEHEAILMVQKASLNDPLTGLPNRIHLKDKLDQLTDNLQDGTAQNDGAKGLAILSIDLNFFKEVNDVYGHLQGDIVLKTLADRLRACLTQTEFIARTGGDEFVALKYDIKRQDQAQAFAERLLDAILEPIDMPSGQLCVKACIGVVTSLEDGLGVAQLLHKSDLAMNRAKASMQDDICFFDVEMDEQGRKRRRLISDLHEALPNDEFTLVYQVQNDLKTLDPIGFEVMLRWSHPTQGRISPDEFIPIAEETGLIQEIGLWVLRTACIEAASWPVDFKIAVNVAPQQLVQPSFLENVADILFESRLPPSRLELEVTEAGFIEDQQNTFKVMHQLKSMGIGIAMDDFGTGYSSLATLQSFPFDKIKIDRSFVSDVHKDEQRAAIVRSTLLLGSALKIPVLAEGVETLDELQFLQAENCCSVQGFYFGKPMELDAVRSMIFNPPSPKSNVTPLRQVR